MQKTITRKEIEETVLDEYMAVNITAMLYRLIKLLENNKTTQIKDVVDNIRIKSIVWLIANTLFSGFDKINVHQHLKTMQLLNIPTLTSFSSKDIAEDLIERLRHYRTTSLQEIISKGCYHAISGIIRFLEPFSVDDMIDLGRLWTLIHNNSPKCETCDKYYFESDTHLQPINDNVLNDLSDFNIRVCYNCGNNHEEPKKD